MTRRTDDLLNPAGIFFNIFVSLPCHPFPIMNIQDDLTLFHAAQRDDKEAFDRIFMKYYPIMCSYARQFVPADQGEEIVQGIMVNLWDRRRSTELTSSLHSYLFTSVRNKCLSAFVSVRRREELLGKIYERVRDEIETPDFYDINTLSHKIREAVGKLPEDYRRAFVMNRYEEKTYRQIADELGVSPKTVDYRICQSLKILRHELKDYLPLFLLGLL